MGEARNTQIIERFAPSAFYDNDALFYGSGKDSGMMYDISDANAHLLKTDFLAGGANHVPVHAYGVDIFDRDLTFFNGETQPQVAVVDLDRDSYVELGFQADDQPAIRIGGSATILYLPDVQATQVTIYSAENLFYLTESDQTDPAGRWRFRVQADIMYLEHATSASWAADEDWLTFTYGASITAGKAIIMAEATNPAGTYCYIGRDNTGDLTLNALSTKAVNIAVAGTDVILAAGDAVTFNQKLAFSGTYTSHVINFSGITQAAGDISLIRAGSYASPMDAAGEAQYGMIRLYLDTDDNGTSYNRGLFVALKTSGTKGIFPVAGLAEVLAQSANGPTAVGAAQFISHLFTSTSKVDARGSTGWANFYGAWLKVTSEVGSEARTGSVVAPLWLDNQMNGTVNGEEYAAFITCGTSPDAVFGFEVTAGVGWTQLFYFDDTCYNLAPISNTSLKVLLNTTQYYIPLSTANDSFSSAYGIIIGSDAAGADVTFYGATSGSLLQWDASDDRLEFTNARESITITGTSTGKIGSTVATTQAVAHSGWALGYFGTTTLSATSGSAVNAAGGVFEVNQAAAYAASSTGIQVGAYIGAYGNAAGRRPNAVLYCEAIAGTGNTAMATMPVLALVTSGAGTMPNIAIEFGHEPAGKTVSTGAGGMYHLNTIQVKVNTVAKYLPLSTAENTLTLGADTAGVDMTLYGDATGAYLLWDASEEGLTISQGATDTFAVQFKSSDVAHGATDLAETDTYATFAKVAGVSGGLVISAFRENNNAINIMGYAAGNMDTTKSTAGVGQVNIYAAQTSGTGIANAVADGNLFAVIGRVGAAWSTAMIVDEDGDLWLNGRLTLSGLTPSANYGIRFSETMTDTDNTEKNGIYTLLYAQKTAAAYTSISVGLVGRTIVGASNTQNWTSGCGLQGVKGDVRTETGSTGTITGAACFFGSADFPDAATVTNWYGVHIPNPNVAGSKLTNAYGIYIATQDHAATLNYGIYIGGGTSAAIYVASGKIIQLDTRTVTGEEHMLDVSGTYTFSSGDGGVAGNFAITTAGASGAWASGIFAKVNQAGAYVTGYLSGAEFEINLTGAAWNPCDNATIVLNYNNSITGSFSDADSAWIYFRNYGTYEPASLFRIYDVTLGTLDATKIITTVGAAYEANCDHAIRIVHLGVPYWILLSSVAPA